MDTFKTIEEFPMYEINTIGQIRSKYSNKILKHKVKTIIYNKSTYTTHQICLCKDGKKYYKSIHRLIAKAFIPNPDNKPDVDHIDHNPENNSLENLRWATHTENMRNKNKKSNNNSGHLHIHKYERQTTPLFEVRIIRGDVDFRKYFGNLEEAIKARDDYLNSL